MFLKSLKSQAVYVLIYDSTSRGCDLIYVFGIRVLRDLEEP